MQYLKSFGEWQVAIEFANFGTSASLPFDVGMFGRLKFLLAETSRKYLIVSWFGRMEDLLDLLTDFTRQPSHPDLTVEVWYENVLQGVAGTLTAGKGQCRTSMELRTSLHSEVYLDLHAKLCMDCLSQDLSPAMFNNGRETADDVIAAIVKAQQTHLTSQHLQNTTALESALDFAVSGLSGPPPVGTPEHDKYIRACNNVANRLDSVIRDLGLELFGLATTVVAGTLFPTVGDRLLDAMRKARLRTLNQPATPAVSGDSGSEFSDSFPE